MTDLVGWLRDCLDEDEQVAAPFRNDAGTAQQWCCDETGGKVRRVGPDPLGNPDQFAQVDTHMHAVHIARHDPARVLADIESKRALLTVLLAAEAAIVGDRLLTEPCRRRGTDALDTALRLLAQPYSDRAGFLEEWRVPIG